MHIIRDSREKKGIWEFTCEECESVTVQTLKTGDYTLRGCEDILCIERKRTVTEFCNNVTDKRFKNELERMQVCKYRFLILEFSIDDIMRFPVGSSIPKYKWSKLRVTGKFMMAAISRMQVHYNVHVIFAGDRDNAILTATNIMRRVHSEYLDK